MSQAPADQVSPYELELVKAAIEGRDTWWTAKAEEYAQIIRSGEYGEIAREYKASQYGDMFPAFDMKDGRRLSTNESGIWKELPSGGRTNISLETLRDADDYPDYARKCLAQTRAGHRHSAKVARIHGWDDEAKTHDQAVTDINKALETLREAREKTA
jgi:hypothetical protein